MADLRTDWTDNIGMQVDASFLNSLDTAVNTNTHARTLTGTRSALPTAASGNSGAIYVCTDCDAQYLSNGSSWSKVRIAGLAGSSMADAPTSGWTAVNMQTGASFASDKDAMLFTIPSAGTPPIWQYQYRAYPTPPFTLTIYVDVTHTAPINATSGSAWSACGIVISDGTKLITAGPQGASSGVGNTGPNWNVWAAKFNTVTSYNAIYNDVPATWFTALPRWYRLTDDNTNIKFECSVNGNDWSLIGGPEARTTFLTPSRIGVGCTNTIGSSLLARLRSWNIA